MLRLEIARGADFCSGILSLISMGANDGVLTGSAMGISILNSSGTTVAIFRCLADRFVSYLCNAALVVGVDLRRLTEVLLAIHNPVTLEIDLQNNRITFSQPGVLVAAIDTIPLPQWYHDSDIDGIMIDWIAALQPEANSFGIAPIMFNSLFAPILFHSLLDTFVQVQISHVRMIVVGEYAQFAGGTPGRYEFTLGFQGGFIRRGNMPLLALDLYMTVPVQTALLDASCICTWVWICRSDRGHAVFLFEVPLYGYVVFVFQD